VEETWSGGRESNVGGYGIICRSSVGIEVPVVFLVVGPDELEWFVGDGRGRHFDGVLLGVKSCG
jgi:hypothetical protein